MENAIENKVAQSGLIQLDLETFRIPGERIFFDIRPLLFMDLVLKEKDFRAFLGDHSWNQYQGKHVAISCSSDAIIPTWAYMLVSTQMSPFASSIVYGNLEDLEKEFETLKENTVQKLSSLKDNESESDVVKTIKETIEKIQSEKFDQLNYVRLKQLGESIVLES